MNDEYKNRKLELKEKFSAVKFENYDFSSADFNSAIFENVSFVKCVFNKTNLDGSKIFYESNFESCTFSQVNLSNTTFAGNSGIYKNCTFEKCKLQSKEFNHTVFVECTFNKCTLKKINFNGSKFINCKFVGKIEDTCFNGIYDTNSSPNECLNSVDFSGATFGEFVTFHNCNLSSCIPPIGKTFESMLYQLYASRPHILSTGTEDRIILD